MPGLGRYPCLTCHYVASNRRMLARHAVLIHSVKSFKCPVCPFITRYAANWYRHKRDQHGLTKLTTCEVCGFFANSTEELAQHKESEHLELLQLPKYEDKYAKEKLRLGVESTTDPPLPEVEVILCEPSVEENIEFLEPYLGNGAEQDDLSSGELSPVDDSITFSLPLDGGLLDSDYVTNNVEPQTQGSDEITISSNVDSLNKLKPPRIRRSYFCDPCKLLTSDPREYLYHCRDTHGEKISVHECKWCIYASKHMQKLQRHCKLVHPQQLAEENELKKQLEAKEKEEREQREAKEKELREQHEAKEKELREQREAEERELRKQQEKENELRKQREKDDELKRQIEAQVIKQIEAKENHLLRLGGTRTKADHVSSENPTVSTPRKRNQCIFKCSECNYQTRNKILLAHHEKTVHLKKKLYSCLKCEYSTNEKSRYTKHLKYHNLPKARCEFCFFQTSYKWNMDRHMKNHVTGAEGEFTCTLCNFTTQSKQSLKSHVNNHHNVSFSENCNQQIMINTDNQESFSESQWEDISLEGEDLIEGIEEGNFPVPEEFPTNEAISGNWNYRPRVLKTNLKCNTCDYKATWPFELKRHEENHKSQKKHPCPLCGMRFEHIAWLTKHICRVHKENSQAKNLAAAFELLKPNRRRPAKNVQKDAVLPMFQDVLKQTGGNVSRPQNTPKPSMLSTLLKKPTYATLPTSLSKFANSNRQKSKLSPSLARQMEMSNYVVPPRKILPASAKNKANAVPTCPFCGYKTRWSSELERHMRVHNHEKPFHCPKCKYHCKWKGDLNRHLMKYHGIKVPSSNKKNTVPKLKLKKASSDKLYSASDWETVHQETNHSYLSPGTSLNDQDSPLDLRLAKSTFPHPYQDIYKICEFEKNPELNRVTEMESADINKFSSPRPMPANSYSEPSNIVEDMQSPAVKKKYQCPFCVFLTSTASRFHVHIVQHYNKRPFMCSLCGYNSNWEWDITKHIRLKGCKDKSHNKACVLLTDETGRRNYDKYEKYLVDVDKIKSSKNVKPVDANKGLENEVRYNPRRAASSNPTNKNCTYDFKNIASNFENDPVSIVVTPDIDIPGSQENSGKQDNLSVFSRNFTGESETAERLKDFKQYFCKHCNYKHSTKRVVISHLAVHAGLKPFRCRSCGLSSNWRHVIVRHVKDVHDGYMNNVEDRITYVQEGYAIRLTSVNTASRNVTAVTENPKAQFGCKLCPYTCDKEFYIKFHMKQHRPRDGATYECTFCPYFVKFKKTLIKHMKLHNNARSTTKRSSGNSYSSMNTDSYNDMPVMDNDPYNFNNVAEDSISESVDQFYSNGIEQISPQKIKRHICENCPYKTDNKTQYLYHKQFHRPNASARFKCNVCSYWATMQHLLTQHMKVHSEFDAEVEDSKSSDFDNFETDDPTSPENFNPIVEQISVVYVKRGVDITKMFKCNHCPMMNKKRANVRVHQKMHGVVVKNGKFACSYCDYQCLNQGGLTNHMKIHRKNANKQTFLNHSETGFNDEESTLTKHQRSVDGPVVRKLNFSYFCMRCPALFKSPNDLKIHKKFHGSTLPFPCPHCDYRAKHRPHLFKHLQVHSPAYVSKRKASRGQPVNSGLENGTEFSESADRKPTATRKKIDQMLLLEASEVKASLKMTNDSTTKLHKCVFCPASFFKTSTVAYHISLHGSEGEFKCSQCDYSTTRLDNLNVHMQVHPVVKKTPVKRPPARTFSCSKCPALFYKQDRYLKHFDLHGKKYRYICDQCDYSVHFAANLFKHKNVHVNTVAAPENATSSPVENNDNNLATASHDATTATSVQSTKPQNEIVKSFEVEDKKIYVCDRCPYSQSRKDAVQSHQRRHWLQDGLQCLYCDYSSMNSSKLRDHVKMHVQSTQMFPAQAFMKFENFEIWCKESDGDKTLLFEDKEISNSDGEDIEKSSDSQKVLKTPIDTAKAFRKICQTEKSTPRSKNLEDTNFVTTSSMTTAVVVLSDIFTHDKDLKRWAPEGEVSSLRKKLKMTHLLNLQSASKGESMKQKTINDCVNMEEKRSSEALHKPNIVVKIKVENRLTENSEKTMYSITTNNSEHVISDDTIPDDSEDSSENPQSESQISDDSPESSITEDVEKLLDGTISNMESKDNAMDTHSEMTTESVSYNNQVPVVIVADILPDCLQNFKLQQNLNSVTNGDSDTHLSNKLSLLTDDVQVPI